ncbi:hypothetical protein [Neorhizobium sp. AL 9.2.2]|uniref:hypothetical protein n=1 Tax=Neorhizobium sp. AL 9.2.2 TaxID=2712894 RepID=UPI001571ECFC|nr:hypothetical protein [Neorhizobium sp. AL 9.2.2]NSY17216.1 hypothetical protein [Neorhizobium sp. AL 9.2.2]
MTEQNKQSDTPAPAQHVVVTPLEWTAGDWEFTAQTPFGHYVARESRDQWIMTGLAGGVHNSIEAFQRAANADFEERVRACLNPSPQPKMVGGADE